MGGKFRVSWFSMGKRDFHNVSKNCLAQRRQHKTEIEWADLNRLREWKGTIAFNYVSESVKPFYFCNFFENLLIQDSRLTLENPKQEMVALRKKWDEITEKNGTRIVIGVLLDKDGFEVQVWLRELDGMEEKTMKVTKNDIDLYGEERVTWFGLWGFLNLNIFVENWILENQNMSIGQQHTKNEGGKTVFGGFFEPFYFFSRIFEFFFGFQN